MELAVAVVPTPRRRDTQDRELGFGVSCCKHLFVHFMDVMGYRITTDCSGRLRFLKGVAVAAVES